MKILNNFINLFKKDKIIKNETNIEYEEESKEIVIDLKNALSLFNHKENEKKFDRKFKLFYFGREFSSYSKGVLFIFPIAYFVFFILWLLIEYTSNKSISFTNNPLLYLIPFYIVSGAVFLGTAAGIISNIIDYLSNPKKNIPNKKFNDIINNNLQLKNNYSILFNQDLIKLSSFINNLNLNNNEYNKIMYSLSNIRNDDELNKINKYINLCANEKLELKSEFIEDITYSKPTLDKPNNDIADISEEIKNILPIIEFYKENNVRNILNIDFSAYDNILSKYQSYNILSDEYEIDNLYFDIMLFKSFHNENTDKINILMEIKRMLDENSITDENIVNEFDLLQDNFNSLEIQELKKYKNNLILISNS